MCTWYISFSFHPCCGHPAPAWLSLSFNQPYTALASYLLSFTSAPSQTLEQNIEATLCEHSSAFTHPSSIAPAEGMQPLSNPLLPSPLLSLRHQCMEDKPEHRCGTSKKCREGGSRQSCFTSTQSSFAVVLPWKSTAMHLFLWRNLLLFSFGVYWTLF